MQTWDLLSVHAPNGTRDPLVLHSDDGSRAVLIVLQPGQALGEHQVKENEWVTVLAGDVEISSGTETVSAGPGMTVRFDPDERRTLSSETGGRVLLIFAPWPGAGHYRGDAA